MTSTRNKFLLALVALVLLATYAAAVKGDCSVENCATCLEEDATQCAECKPGYRPTDAGQCEAISCDVPNCATCAAGSTTQCAECNADYQLTTEGQCVAASDAAAAPHSGVAAVAALAAAVVAYAL
ncbi:surface antigen-like protein, putative [Leishmania panamensis]|uniref:Surface antigen-like protein, putative n=2 Tax=Leishmania panamensis TaxID=5679 RepID=A0AC62A6P0_LEIPA